MLNILPVRKIIKFVSPKRGVARRDRVPTSLTEDLDVNVTEQSHLQIYFLIFILLLIYFIHLLRFHYNTNKKQVYFYVFKSSEEANKSLPLNHSDETLPFCNVHYQKIGNTSVNKNVTNVTEILEADYPAVQRGGFYIPEGCRSRHKVALLVPYRNRKKNLATFLSNIHPFLMKQKLEYRIFIIEQKGTALFNRGRLFNVGFKEAKKFGSWKCVVLHDVDLLPLDGRILYTCPMWPRQMCAAIKEIRKKSFRTFFGGVSAMTMKQYERVNGFSNMYWGWGGEDTDLYMRIRERGYPVATYSRKIAIYKSLNHTKQAANGLRCKMQLHDSVPHAVVAVSRHTESCVCFTESEDDATDRFIRGPMKATQNNIIEYNTKMAIKDRNFAIVETLLEMNEKKKKNSRPPQ